MPPHNVSSSLTSSPSSLASPMAPAERGHLARDLKEGTQAAHAAAESVPFVTDFLHGRITQDVYRVMVCMLYYVYEELELQLRRAAASDNPVVVPLHFPLELERLPSLAQDLSFYYGSNWKEVMPSKTPATAAYVARLEHIGSTHPSLLVAHAYTRYLGDLSGGQILKRHAIRAMNLAHGLGTAFYDFKRIESSHKAFKDGYRRALDAAMVDSAETKLMVEEANVAFELNMALFQDLDELRGVYRAATITTSTTSTTTTTTSTSTSQASSGCPFARLAGEAASTSTSSSNVSGCPFARLAADANTRRSQWATYFGWSVAAAAVAVVTVGLVQRTSS